ncbi:hypothetical protein Nepgr_023870 [Nepenthes gracilis]|uniref:GDSL esterase/lipase 1-like n=1 Tax=Nepenthes gracilis TaxID=150966 RepID=A0AAD3T3F3_NEPGR|nr:hypothetical protein Nepgr_023870 [Nepenthes gracilis]
MSSAFAIFMLTFLSLSPSSSVALPDNHVAFFIFGDSLYDVGMTLYNNVSGAGADSWPYGETYFKRPAGRYSDGRLIPDFIAEYAQLPFLPPYLQPGLSNYTNGVNFASAGACVLVETRPQTINLKMQVDYFLQMVEKLKKQLGDAEAGSLLSKAVYMFSIGGNDYVSLVEANLNKPALSASYKSRYMGMVLGNLTAHFRTIYGQGGRKFAIQNVGPIGCMPATKALYSGNVGNCVKEPQLLAKMHNAGVQEILKKLQSQLSGFEYSIFDYYASCANRIIYNNRYGFKESKIACCGTGPYDGFFTCGKKGTDFKVCGDPSDYLWFDAGHHSEKANRQLAQLFWEGPSSIVAPLSLKDLYHKHMP